MDLVEWVCKVCVWWCVVVVWSVRQWFVLCFCVECTNVVANLLATNATNINVAIYLSIYVSI